jgi:hypothetical protein
MMKIPENLPVKPKGIKAAFLIELRSNSEKMTGKHHKTPDLLTGIFTC